MKNLEKLVIFFDKEYETVMELKYEAKLVALGEELQKQGVTVCWKFTEAGKTAVCETEGETEGVLYLTDSPVLLEVLQLWGFYVAALAHEANQKVSFRGNCYILEGLEGLEYSYLDGVYQRLAGIPWNILETERLKVRESTVADVDEFYRIYAEPSITYYMENLFEDPDMERAYMKNYIRRIYGFCGYGMWTILLKETGQVIGRAGLNVRDGYEEPELGFVIDASLQRRGYAEEVCTAILDYARTTLQFPKVRALTEPGNEASKKLLAKLGFKYEKKVQEDGKVYLLYEIIL